jgi:hypothetical protein
MMHRTGGYKMLNMIFGILPFFAAILMTQMKEDSHPAHLWLSIVKHFPRPLEFAQPLTQMPLGFGNAVVLQTMFSKFQDYLIVYRVPVIVGDCFLNSRPGFSSAGVADGCWNGVRSIAKRFRFVDVLNRQMCQFADNLFIRTSRGSCVSICSIPISARHRVARTSPSWFGRSMSDSSNCAISGLTFFFKSLSKESAIQHV